MTLAEVLPDYIPFDGMTFNQKKIYVVTQLIDLWARCLGDVLELELFDNYIIVSENGEHLFSCNLEGGDLLSLFNKTILRLQQEYRLL